MTSSALEKKAAPGTFTAAPSRMKWLKSVAAFRSPSRGTSTRVSPPCTSAAVSPTSAREQPVCPTVQSKRCRV